MGPWYSIASEFTLLTRLGMVVHCEKNSRLLAGISLSDFKNLPLRNPPGPQLA
jgi:hypothetical protein